MRKLTHEEIFKALLDGKGILNKETGFSYIIKDGNYTSLQYGYVTSPFIPENTTPIVIIEPKCRNLTLQEIIEKFDAVEFNKHGDLMVTDGDLHIGIQSGDLHLLGKEFKRGDNQLSSRFVEITYE